MKLRYLRSSRGLLMYQRRFPNKLKQHPRVRSNPLYQKSLELREGASEEAILRAWKSANTQFEQYIQSLELANWDILEQAQKIEIAKAHLDEHGLKRGQLAPNSHFSPEQNAAYRDAVMEENAFYKAFSDFLNYDHLECTDGLTPQIEMESLAWKILNEPTSVNSDITTLTQCWNIYEDLNSLDMRDDNNKMAKSRYLRFVRLIGDQPITQSVCNKGLITYVETREKERQESGGKTPSESTIRRELNAIRAVLTTTIERKDLDIVLRRIKTKKTIPKQRHTYTTDELRGLAELIQDRSLSLYEPWKELMFLFMLQTGIIQSELQRLRIENVHLDHEIPHVDLLDKLKDPERTRTNPIVFKVERIKELIAQLDDGSGYAFGPYREAEAGGKQSKTVNKALVKFAKQLSPDGGTYPFRHAFKWNCRVNRVDTESISALGGWSGKALGMSSDDQTRYGKSGIKYIGMMRMLRDEMLRINSYLFTDESGKVVAIGDRRPK